MNERGMNLSPEEMQMSLSKWPDYTDYAQALESWPQSIGETLAICVERPGATEIGAMELTAPQQTPGVFEKWIKGEQMMMHLRGSPGNKSRCGRGWFVRYGLTFITGARGGTRVCRTCMLLWFAQNLEQMEEP